MRDALLSGIGVRVRALREEQGLSRRELAATSGISERFLADLEAGAGNISVQRLSGLARALGVTGGGLLTWSERALGLAARTPGAAPGPGRGRNGEGAVALSAHALALLDGLGKDELLEVQRWLQARFGGGPGPMVALLGLRGAGKSTIGARLAQRLSVPFIELDEEVERAAGLALPDIFSLHGEAYYRRLAREVLTRLLAGTEAAVLATGGSLVTDREAFSLLQKRCRTVWLQATPEDHWQRVLAQGDERPGGASPHAQSELRALLKAREPLYAQAELAIDTSRLGVDGAVSSVLRRLAPRS